jgi:AAA+ superfamily predicted ATPase
MMLDKLILEILKLPPAAIRRGLTTAVRDLYPDHFVTEIGKMYPLIQKFSFAGHCELLYKQGFKEDAHTHILRDKIFADPTVDWWEFTWMEHEFELISLELGTDYHQKNYSVVVGPSKQIIKDFLLELNEFSKQVDRSVLIYSEGFWKYDEDLFNEIQSSTFENLILPDGTEEKIKGDIQNWLNSKELYESHGIPWKRGIIMAGPPGNGKTHMIKALINHFGINALYVRSFSGGHASEFQHISDIFERARSSTPALLIFEDLDTLVSPQNRSYLLNEMDGFSLNSGILTIATANDPARLDPALLNRPSRFDRRYEFSNPETLERAKYLQFFTSHLDESLKLSEDQASQLAEQTDGFSYAYLKELVLSSMMSWISGGRESDFKDVLANNIAALQSQIRIDPQPTPVKPEPSENWE